MSRHEPAPASIPPFPPLALHPTPLPPPRPLAPLTPLDVLARLPLDAAYTAIVAAAAAATASMSLLLLLPLCGLLLHELGVVVGPGLPPVMRQSVGK